MLVSNRTSVCEHLSNLWRGSGTVRFSYTQQSAGGVLHTLNSDCWSWNTDDNPAADRDLERCPCHRCFLGMVKQAQRLVSI